ncbi:non-ribosomal peptide synthetase [Streptomyces sp. NBC_00237]|uniref:non-ribosomal peptide synthetase n=1 Tax=Streptomyces sp. NBC_00237 TaxID=2975687 RepID=UPI0022513239|nr:non-ribosomal peptide synthetase [Streptomyces sp. NBC_00237]MCX5202702.1 non-ribosomal peptide synthetase [Streptomyces sp. NBC_00237]
MSESESELESGISSGSGDLRQPTDVLELLRLAVRSDPHRIAVHGPDGTWDFAQLDEQTLRLAAALSARGVGRGARVGVCLPRGGSLVVAMLAVWRAGAAYVPLDPHHPRRRLAEVAGRAGLHLLIAEDDGGDGTGPAPLGVPVLMPGTLDGHAPHDTPPVRSDPLDPAYVIFTSGSTGTPKGVEVTRGGVASLAASLEQAGVYAEHPRVVAWNAGVAFDASVQQWIRVCRGDTLVVLDEADRLHPERLAAVLDRHRVDDLDLTPSHWELLRDVLLAPRPDGRRLRLLMGGEPVPGHTWRELAAATRRGVLEAVNLYGPTECTVDATAAWITGDAPTIGRELPGVRLYVLDDELRPVPEGEPGEMFLAGPRLANGYLHRPALTARHFLADPYGPPGTRMYATGDRARHRPDGALEFLGRRDRQAKIRGYRVELGEVERVLEGARDVATAHVVPRGAGAADARLVAYVTGAGSAPPSAQGLRRYAADVLPDYMVPTSFVVLTTMPLTANGKIDTAALPEPQEDAPPTAGNAGSAGNAEDTAAFTAELWSTVLRQEVVEPHDDFFALGGQSLAALRVLKKLKDGLGLPLSIKDIYRYPVLADLVAHLESLRAQPADN